MVAHLIFPRPEGPELILLSGSAMSIGRGSESDVTVPDESVSRLHAALKARSGGWSLRDLGSRNGTFVNNERIVGERALRDRDEIRVGGARLTYRADPTLECHSETVFAHPPPALTRREREVLLALFRSAGSGEVFMEPASSRRIAEVLVVSEAAVKQHLLRLYEKFEIPPGGDRRRVQLANEALRRGAISLSEVREILR